MPIDTTGLGQAVLAQMPVIRQAIVARGAGTPDQDAFERKLLAIRKQTQNPLDELALKYGLPGADRLLHAVVLDAARWSTRACCSRPRWAPSTRT